MAKCKSCKTNIPEDTEYCNDCQDKVGAKANESYLDSLLNSVKTSPTVENIYKKKNSTKVNNNPDEDINQVTRNSLEQVSKHRQRKASVHTPETDEDDLYRVDFSDIEDFDQFNFQEDLSNINSDIIINDEDLFGESLSSLREEVDSYEALDVQKEVNNAVDFAYNNEQQATSYIEEEEVIANNIEEISQTFLEEVPEEVTLPDVQQNNDTDVATMMVDEAVEAMERPDAVDLQDEYSELSEDTDIDLDLDELLNNIDTLSLEAAVENNMANQDEDMFSTFGSDDDIADLLSSSVISESTVSDLEQIDSEQDDFFSLLGQVSEEDEAAEDIRAISDMLAGNLESSRNNNMPSNVGEVFSDALKAVSSLNDYELEEASILDNIPEKDSKKSKKGKKKKVQKEKANKEKNGDNSKSNLFQRLFGNVKDNKTAANFEEEQRKLIEPKAEKKKKTKSKDKNNATASDEEDETSLEKKGGKDKATKKADKKEKAEKKKKTKEVIEVIDEIDEDPGRINRVGAIIVFFFCGIIAIILILGTNIVTYTISIQHATSYFDHRKYNQAYNEVYGVDIKDEDIGLYDKIQTVMFVNKQLNSYNNYCTLEKYPEALDSLLKGLSRYEKYIELATMLGIESDLDYVRSQILAELNNVFKLTETDAMQIISYNNNEDYSLEVYDVVLEEFNN
jgi:hypothetical protein